MTLPTILLIEDSEDDIFFMRRAVASAKILNPVQVVTSGQEAIDYLSGKGQFADRRKYPMPCLVLLDLKLPFVPGLDVLGWIRQQPELATMLVVVLTSSRENPDVDRAYRLGANSYLVKPPNPANLQELVRCLADYWLRFNIQPCIQVGP